MFFSTTRHGGGYSKFDQAKKKFGEKSHFLDSYRNAYAPICFSFWPFQECGYIFVFYVLPWLLLASLIARDRERRPSTNQITASTRATPAIYQSYLPDGQNHPAYIAHRTRTPTYKNAQHTAALSTIDVQSRHRTSPRSTRFELGKASEYRRQSRSYHVDPLSRKREVAHGVLRSSPKPEQTFFFQRTRASL